MLVSGKDRLSYAPAGSSVLRVALHEPLISDEKLKQLYAAMLKVRLWGRRLHPRGTGSRFKPSFQEAPEVACTIDLRLHDTIAASEEKHFVSVVRGFSPLITRERPQRREGQNLSLSLFQNRSSAERLIFATGVAFAYRIQKKDNVVVAFSDKDGFAGARDSLRLAFAYRLPVIFVQQGARISNSRRFENAHQPPVVPVDQRDAVAVYRVAYEAIDKARRGVGPTVIQCIWQVLKGNKSAHCIAYSEDPIEYMERHLRKKNLWSDEFKREIEASFLEEIKSSSAARKRRASAVQNGNASL